MEDQTPRFKGKRKIGRRIGVVLLAVVVVCCVGFGVYVSDFYRAGAVADEAAGELAAAGEYQETDAAIAVGDDASDVGIVLYPGAKVEARAYIPLAQSLAERGYYCVIAKMPFNLAFFGIDSAAALMGSAPEVDEWWLAGHSLGGAMAAQYAGAHAGEIEGLLLLASYAANDLSATDLAVLVAYGSNDGVLNRQALQDNEGNLPAGAQTVVIEGGNHAGFGDYGPQDGDGEATIDSLVQWSETADLVSAVIEANEAV